MTEVNLKTLWPSYQSHEQVYCIPSLVSSVHNFNYTLIYVATLGAAFFGPRVRQGMYTIRGKPAVQLPR